jgi:hypothetical protein
MAVQPFVRPWPLFQFLDLLRNQYDSLEGVQAVSRPIPAHRTAQTQNKDTQTSMPQVELEPAIPVFERAKTVHALDRTATAIGTAVTPTGNYNNKNITKQNFPSESGSNRRRNSRLLWSWRFITVFARIHLCALFWARWIQSTFSHPMFQRPMPIQHSQSSDKVIRRLSV